MEETEKNANLLGLTLTEIKDYLSIDYSDERSDRNLNRTLKVAHLFLKGAIGENYQINDERAKEVALAVIDDLYSVHGMNDKVSSSTRRLINDFILQLKLELVNQEEQ